MGSADDDINSAVEKVQWAAIHFADLIPDMRSTLANMKSATESTEKAARVMEAAAGAYSEVSLLSIDDAAKSADKAAQAVQTAAGMFTLLLIVVAIFAVIRLFSRNARIRKDREREAHRQYIRDHYGDDIEMITKTYLNLMRMHRRIWWNGDLESIETNIPILIGPNEEIESHMWSLCEKRYGDCGCVFATVGDAMKAVDEYCRRDWLKEDVPRFTFILISSQDPTISGPHVHDTFAVPSRLRNYSYAFVGTGFHGVAAHKFTRSSTGADGDPLVKSLNSAGQKISGIVF